MARIGLVAMAANHAPAVVSGASGTAAGGAALPIGAAFPQQCAPRSRAARHVEAPAITGMRLRRATMNSSPAKIGALLFYAAALLSLFLEWPPQLEQVLQWGTLLLLATHMLEVVICLRWIRLYPGPLAVSIVLTLLFGFVHWLPYKRQAERAGGA
jgi:hypothetical protein